MLFSQLAMVKKVVLKKRTPVTKKFRPKLVPCMEKKDLATPTSPTIQLLCSFRQTLLYHRWRLLACSGSNFPGRPGMSQVFPGMLSLTKLSGAAPRARTRSIVIHCATILARLCPFGRANCRSPPRRTENGKALRVQTRCQSFSSDECHIFALGGFEDAEERI